MAKFTDSTRSFGYTKPYNNFSIDWDHPLAKSLAGCWLFNNAGEGTSIEIANGINANKVGGVSKAPGNFNGPAASFDGTTGYYNVKQGIRPFLAGTQRFSISAWVQLNSNTAGTIMSDTSSTSAGTFDGFSLYYSVGSWNAGGSDGAHSVSVVSATETPTVGRWYHVAATWDCTNPNGTVKIWVDGGRLASSTTILRALAIGGDYRIGHSTESPTFWHGQIDNVCFWGNRLLTSIEVRKLYEEPFCFIGQSRPKTVSLIKFIRNLNPSITDTLALTQSVTNLNVLNTFVIDTLSINQSIPIRIVDKRTPLKRFNFGKKNPIINIVDTVSFNQTVNKTDILNISKTDTIAFSDAGTTGYNVTATNTIGFYDRSTLTKVKSIVPKYKQSDRGELGSEIDWQNQITQGLLFCALFNENAGQAHNIAFNNYSGPTQAIWKRPGYYDTQNWLEDPRLNLTTGITVLAQIIYNGAITANLASKYDGGVTSGYKLFLNGSTPQFNIWNGFANGISASQILLRGKTSVVAGTYNNSIASIYIDGRFSASNTLGAGKLVAPVNTGLLIGDSTKDLGCTLVMIWNRALNRAEIGIDPLSLIKRPTKRKLVVNVNTFSDTHDVIDSFSFSSAVSQLSVRFAPVTDIISLTDLPNLSNLHVYVVDTLSITDVFYPGNIWKRSVSDTVTFVNYAVANYHYYFIDSIALFDTLKRGGVNYRSVTQRFIISQGLNEPYWSLAHTIQFLETAIQTKTFNISITDNFSLIDTKANKPSVNAIHILDFEDEVLLNITKQYPSVLSTITFTNSIHIKRVISRNFSDTISFGSYTTAYDWIVRT